MLEPERERQLAEGAQLCAHAVYSFLHACQAACASLNQSLTHVQTGFGPLPVLHTIPLPLRLPASATEQQLGTPVKEAPKSLSFPAMAADSHLWDPAAALFQQHLCPAPGSGGATRSTGRAGQRRGSGHHSPPKQPPPLFDAAPQQHHAAVNGGGWLAKTGSNVEHLHAGLVHWASEVSANMVALGATPVPGPAPAAAGSPLSSPRAAALMAVCREEAEQGQQQPQPLARLTSNLSSHYSACPPGGEAAAGVAAAVAPGGSLVKQKSDLADLAQLAEEEYQAAAVGAATAAARAGGQQQRQAAPAQPPSDTASQEHQQQDGAGAQAQHSGAELGCKRESESEESKAEGRHPPTKRQRIGTDSPQQDSTDAAPASGGVAAAVAGAAEAAVAAHEQPTLAPAAPVASLATQRRLSL